VIFDSAAKKRFVDRRPKLRMSFLGVLKVPSDYLRVLNETRRNK
jgi:hypothetical protein